MADAGDAPESSSFTPITTNKNLKRYRNLKIGLLYYCYFIFFYFLHGSYSILGNGCIRELVQVVFVEFAGIQSHLSVIRRECSQKSSRWRC